MKSKVSQLTGQSEDQIKNDIGFKYHVDSERLDGDLYDFFTHLKQLNLLEIEE